VFRKPKAVVGLDIGSSAVKAVQLKPSGKQFRVAAFASEPVPADAIVDGAIIDADAVVSTIKRLFDSSKAFKTKEVCASLSGNTVIVKKITLPVMTEAELRDSIYWEAEQYIPFDIQDVNLDYQVLDPGTGPDSRGSMDVLLVAAKKEKIGDYTSVITRAGRTPVVVDVDAFALQNAFEANYGFEPSRVVVLLNAGASAIIINIVQGDQSVFTRDISIGGNAYTEAVQKELGLSFEAAEQLKRGVPVDGGTVEDGAAGRHRERGARGTEDARVLQGHVGRRAHRPDCAQRRRLAGWRPARAAGGAPARPGRILRSVPQREVGCREAGQGGSGAGRIHGRGRRGPGPAAGG
jgi:type IV pilus assembly protein PilM